MTTLTNPDTGQTVTVPDNVAESYTSQGWVRPGTHAPAEPARRKRPRKKVAQREAEAPPAIDEAEPVAEPDKT